MFPEDSHGLFFFRDVKQEENLLMFLCGNEPENRSSNSSSGSGLVAKSFPTREIAWAAARQAPLPTGFSRQEYWRGLPCPPPGDLPDPGIEPVSYVSCIGRRVLYNERHLGSPCSCHMFIKWMN